MIKKSKVEDKMRELSRVRGTERILNKESRKQHRKGWSSRLSGTGYRVLDL